jgi:mannose-6-phosphate isomerase-like protein (cupin superfamily)
MENIAKYKKNISKPDETRTFDKGKLDVVKMGNDAVVGRAVFMPGWKWSTCVKEIAQTSSCESAHLGYVISGRMQVAMDNGTNIEYGPDDVLCIPPGHDAWTLGNEPCVVLDFSGYENYAKSK